MVTTGSQIIRFFKRDPFKLSLDTGLYYLSHQYEHALKQLGELLNPSYDIAVMCGENGVGKTLTVKKFLFNLPSRANFAYFTVSSIPPLAFFSSLTKSFNIKTNSTTAEGFKKAFINFLDKVRQDNKIIFLAFDNSNEIDRQTLHEIKSCLSKSNGALKLIFIGTPGLKEILQNVFDPLELQLIFYFNNLNLKETSRYIDYRLNYYGYNSAGTIIGRKVWRYTSGNPSKINSLMSRTVAAASIESSQSIDKNHLKKAVKSLSMIKRPVFRPLYVALGSLFIILISLGLGYSKYPFKSNAIVPNISDETEVVRGAASESNYDDIDSAVVEEKTVDTAVVNTVVNLPTVPLDKPQEQAKKIQAVVISNRLNVREFPDITSVRIALLLKDDMVEVLEIKGDWVKIKLTDGGSGWVSKLYLGIGD